MRTNLNRHARSVLLLLRSIVINIKIVCSVKKFVADRMNHLGRLNMHSSYLYIVRMPVNTHIDVSVNMTVSVLNHT